MAAEHFQGLFPGVFRSFQYITYIPDTETGEEVIHIADKGLFPLLVGDHVVAGDNADPGGTVHEKTEHAGGYAAGLNCILPNIAENSFHRGLRVDENNGNIQIDQAPDGVRDFLGADRKNDRAGNPFFSHSPDTCSLSFGIGASDLVIFHLNIKTLKILYDYIDALTDPDCGLDLRQDNFHLHLPVLIVQRLGQRIRLVTIFLQKLLDFLSFFLAHAGAVMDHLIHCGFSGSCHFGDLL